MVIDPCEGRTCCCALMSMDLPEPAITDDSIAVACCSSPQSMPCHLNKKRLPDTQTLIVSVTTENHPEMVDEMSTVVGIPSALPPFNGNTTNIRCWLVVDSIPIYFQNLTLIC